jgi:hypothetical protein
MTTAAQRRSDVQLIVVTASLVIGAAVFVAVGLLLTTRGADSPECTLHQAGATDDLVASIEEGGPSLRASGEDCGYWLDVADGEVVAYRVEPRDRECTVRQSTNEDLVTTYTCGGEEVDASELDRYPTWMPIVDGVDAVFVDLRADRPCDAYDLGVASALDERVAESGAVLVTIPDCGELWLAPDQSGNAMVVVTDTDDCAIERDAGGDLLCGDDEVGAAQLPAYPAEAVTDDDGNERLVVDLTASPS